MTWRALFVSPWEMAARGVAGAPRNEQFDMTLDEAVLSKEMGSELRRRKNAGKLKGPAGKARALRATGSNKWTANVGTGTHG
jgi:hypothetical protein